jgi:SNF2 family DNA or RNA helicase
MLSFHGLNLIGCRTKDIIKDQLPKKSDEVVFCPLTEMQVDVYKRILGMEEVQNMIKKDEPCNCRKGKRYGTNGGLPPLIY